MGNMKNVLSAIKTPFFIKKALNQAILWHISAIKAYIIWLLQSVGYFCTVNLI